MKKTLILILIIGFVSCQSQNESTSNTQDIAVRADLDKNGLDIDSKIISLIEKDIDKNSEPLNREIWKYTVDGNEEHYFLDTGVIFKFIDENSAHLIFEKYHDRVIESGNYIFLSNMAFDKSFNSYFDIVIIDCSDPFKLINLIGTNGLNYDLFNADIIDKLKEWDSEVGFVFEVIDDSRIHAYMTKLPADIPKFTKDIYEFCPDVVDQGYGSMEDMISDYKQNNYFWLWWD